MGTVSISWCLLHMNVSVLHSPLALEGYGKQKKGQPAIEERGPAPAARCGGAKEADERWSFIARFIFRHPLSRLLNLACSPGFVSQQGVDSVNKKTPSDLPSSLPPSLPPKLHSIKKCPKWQFRVHTCALLKKLTRGQIRGRFFVNWIDTLVIWT